MLALNENALITALRAHRSAKLVLKTVDSLPALFGDKLLAKYVADAPALYVVPGRIEAKDDVATMEFTVAGVVRNVAGHAQARKGDGIDIGCDGLLALAVRALHAQRLGSATWMLASAQMADDELFATAGVSVIEMRFVSSGIALDADFGAEQLEELDDLELAHADFDIQRRAAAVHQEWLQTPADYSDAPDMQADVALGAVL